MCFQFNKRILGYFCVDLTEVWMATRLAGKDTRFLPFNQGSNGAGRDGGAGNPPNPNGYLTAYLWEEVFQKDSMMDILQKFMSLQDGKTLIFPRYHQLDVVRKLVADVRQKGAGQHYLIQHSAGPVSYTHLHWEKGPDRDFIHAMHEALGEGGIIAEDLGYLTPEVKACLLYTSRCV